MLCKLWEFRFGVLSFVYFWLFFTILDFEKDLEKRFFLGVHYEGFMGNSKKIS